MKKKVSNYADLIEKNKSQLKAGGYSESDIEGFKRKKVVGVVKESHKLPRV
jgi:hypothetical protein